MSIKTIFKAGRVELRRKSSLRRSNRDLAEKDKTLSVKLTALGKKARDAGLDISRFGDLSGTLSKVEEKGKDISAKLDELNKQTLGLEERKKAENARFDTLWKDLEMKKKPVDSELKPEKGKQEKAQKEADSIQKRLKNIPDEEEKIRKKITESQGNAQVQAELEKKLTALHEEQKQLEPKLPELTKIIQAAREKITPLELQAGRLEAEMKKAKDQHKKEIEDIDKTLSRVKAEIQEFNKQQKAVSGQQVQSLQALGKKLSEANITNPAIAAEMDAVKAGEKKIASLRAAIESLESQKAPGARGAVWKMAGLVFLFLVIIAAIAVVIVFLSKHKPGKKGEGDAKTIASFVEKKETLEARQESSDSPGSSKIDLRQVATNLEKIIPAFARAVKEIPQDPFDPQALVDKIGKDPEALFYWVRDNTSFIPYRGILRGTQGVLIDRLGNSLDRAVLLANLLELAGNQVRLAHASLSESEAGDLMLRGKPASEAVREKASWSHDNPAWLADLTGQLAIDPVELQRDQEPFSSMDAEKNKMAPQRAASQAAMLLDIIGKFPSHREAMSAREVRNWQDHWWVQKQTGSSWEDMDTSAPEAKPGMALTEAKETFETAKLNGNLFHKINIRIVIEQWSGGKLTEKVALEHSLRPSELLGQEVVLSHAPLNWPSDLDFSQDKDPNGTWKTHVLRQNEWLPVLKVGSKTIGQSSFTDSGEIHKYPGRKSRPKGVGGLAKGIFGGLAGQESQEESKKGSYLTAEWLEYEVRAPEEPGQTIRREIFDLIGPAARASGKVLEPRISDPKIQERDFSMLGFIEILPLVCQMTPEFVDWLMVKRLSEFAGFLRDEIVQNKIKDFDGLRRAMLVRMELLQGPLYDWALHRRKWNRHGDRVYADAVNIVNFRLRIAEDEKGRLVWRRIFDIVNNDVAVFPDTEIEEEVVRLNQGVADTVAEQLTMTPSIFHQNTSYLAAASQGQGVRWRIIRDDRDRLLGSHELPPDVILRIKEDLKNGYSVVAPEKPIIIEERPRHGWWRVNLESGQTLGVMDTGFHQEMPEDVIVESETWARVMTGEMVPPMPPGAFETFKDFYQFYGLDLETSRLLYIRLIKAISVWGL